MSALINIAGLTPVEDPSYRYKMPKIAGKIEGRGNGIKTLLCNVKDVALSLNREAPEITKFFGTELGAQTTYETETERAIVNGAHSDVLLQSKLSTYIEKFVLCSNCHLPETHYKIKDGIITQKCLACGTKTVCEMTHKLTTFILAQDKKAKADAKKEGKDKDKKDKKDKKEKKEKKEAAAGGGAATADGAEGDGGAKASTSEKKEKKEKKDKSPREGEPGESTEKKKKSKEKKTFFDSEAPEDGDEDVDDAKAADEAVTRFRAWTLENAAATPEQLVEELRLIQIQHSLRPADRIIVFLGAALTEAGAATAGQLTTHKRILTLLAPSAIQQRHLIAAVEWFCGVKYPSLTRFFPLFLKALYEEDIVEEDIFFNWATDYARNEYSAPDSMIDIDTLEAMKASAAPFVTWLQEAESEDEDGEDDDEEEDEEEEA